MRAIELPAPRPEAVPVCLDDTSDAELVATLLQGRVGPRKARALAADLLDVSGGLVRLSQLPSGVLRDAGLDEEQENRLLAGLALGRRFAASSGCQAPLDLASTTAMLRPLLVPLRHEELHVVLLDGRGHYAGRRRVAMGGDSYLAVRPRDVLSVVVSERAPRFVLAHNHPSGSSTPSPEDVALSARIEAAALLLGVTLVDHLVVAVDGCASAMPTGGAWPRPPMRARVC